jgi:outer membrane receptor protein involved in Fe transport
LSRTSLRLAIGTASVAVALAASAHAADADARSEASLPTVVVVGVTPLPGADVDRDDIAAPVQTATAQDIERTRALDVTAFMNRTLGSVYVNDIQNNSLQPDINFRGYTASPLLGTPQGMSVYLDGVRLNQPFGDVVSWDLIPRAAISAMTLMPGSNPVFGLNTLGGALALRTKDGFSNPGYALELNYGSNSRRQAELEWGGHASSGAYWYGTANKLKDNGWRDDSPTDASQAFTKVGWRDDTTDISLTGAYADTNLTGNGLQDLQLLQRDYDSVYTKPDNTQNKAYLFNLVATRKLNELVTLSGNAYYRNIRTGTFNGDVNDDALGASLYQPTAEERDALAEAGYSGFPVSGETQDNTPFPSWRCIANILLNDEPNEKCNGLANQTRTRQHDGGVSLQAAFNAPLAGRANQFILGVSQVDSRAKFLQSSRFGFLTPDRGIATVDGEGAFADGTQASENAFDARVDLTGDAETRSIYITDSVQIVSAVRLTLSGRYDRTKIDGEDGLTPAGEPGTLTATHRFSRFNPAVGLTVSPTETLAAYFGFNEGSRAPSAIELGCADPENPCRLPNAMAGDPPLDQVITQTFEAGVRGRAGQGVAWNAGVFHADNRDDIMFVADDVAGFGYFKNFGKTRRQGAELALTGRFGPLDVGANYTFLDATFRSPEVVAGNANSSNQEGEGFEGTIDIESGDRIPLIPRHIFKAFATWRVAPRITTSVDFVTLSGSYARGNENNQHQPDGEFYLGPGRTGGYTVVNLGAEYRPAHAVTVFAQIDNVLDHEYYTGAQLGATAFNANGSFVARPFAGPVVDGERPVLGSTFFAPGAPRAYWFGVRYALGQ